MFSCFNDVLTGSPKGPRYVKAVLKHRLRHYGGRPSIRNRQSVNRQSAIDDPSIGNRRSVNRQSTIRNPQ
jgi:hypothetical protein